MAGKFIYKEQVVRQEKGNSGPFDFGDEYKNGSLDRVIASLTAIRQSIPEEYRAAARCEIDYDSRWGDTHFAKIEVTYNRPSTDADEAAREEEVLTKRQAKEAEERQTLARLQAKYGSAESPS